MLYTYMNDKILIYVCLISVFRSYELNIII